MPDRTYTKEEIAALLERAADLQANAPRDDDQLPGLSLSELEDIAEEAGLDASHVRQAAREMDAPRRAEVGDHASQTATHILLERWVPGALTDEIWEDVVVELRHHYESDLGTMMNMPGYGQSTSQQIGRTREWKHTSVSGVETRVMLSPRGEHIRLRLSQRVGWGSTWAEGATYGIMLAGTLALLAGGATNSLGIAIATLVFTLLLAVPLIQYADATWREKKHIELRDVTNRLARLISTTDASSPAAQPTVRQDESSGTDAQRSGRLGPLPESSSERTEQSDSPPARRSRNR